MAAGALRDRVHCQSKRAAADEFGNPLPSGGVWETRFSAAAGIIPKNGGEAVLAGRLQGRQTFIVTLRQSAASRMITPEWRLVDARNASRVFNVRSLADPTGKGAWLELLVEQGVAS